MKHLLAALVLLLAPVPTPAAPAQIGARAEFAGDAASSGWLPAELHLSSYVYLCGTLAGVETEVVLDSGAGMTVIDAAFADELGLESRGAVRARGIGGTQAAAMLGKVELELGALTLHLPSAVRIDLSGVHALLGRRMPVILGQDAFRALVVDVDYPNARVAFHDPARFEYAGPGTTVPLFATAQGLLAAEARIEALPPARFTLDTGSGDTLHVFAHYVEEHGLLDDRAPLSQRRGGGVGGSTVQRVGRLAEFAFGGQVLARMPASFPDGEIGAFATDTVAGNLGAGVLARFRVVFDRSRMRLHLEPADDASTRAWRMDRFGLSCAFEDGAVVVTFVAPGSPAAAAGWKPGERIAAVDGVALAGTSWRAELDRATRAPPGTEIALTVHDDRGTGATRTARTAEYY
jgi:hypothetical protein